MNRDMTGEEVLAEQARQLAENNQFADLQQFLNNSLDTIGCRTAYPPEQPPVEPWMQPHREESE
jgi:hypothetical protein